MAGETGSESVFLGFLEAINTAAKRKADTSSGSSKISFEQAQKELLERYRQAELRAKLRADNEKTTAHSFSKNLNGADALSAQQEARNQRYSKIAISEARILVKPAKELATKAGTLPSWLNMDAIQTSEPAAAFAVRVALMPPELQNNPDVIYREVSRLYYSTDWTHLSPEAYKETSSLINDVFTKFLPAADFNQDQFFQNIDPRFDVYRVHRMTPVEDPPEPVKTNGKPPKVDKTDPGYEEYRDKLIAKAQQAELEKVLLHYQTQLDSPLSADVKKQQEWLRNLSNELSNGMTRDLKVTDSYNDYTTVASTRFNQKDAQEYLDKVTEKKNEVDAQVQQRRDDEQVIKDKMRQKERDEKELEQAKQEGRVVIWNEKLSQEFKHNEHADQEIYRVPHYLSKEDVIMITSGVEGQYRWLSKFRDDLMVNGQAFKLELPDASRWHEAQELIEWLNGEAHFDILRDIRDNFNTWEAADSITNFILHRSKGQKVEDQSRALRFMTNETAQALIHKDYANIAMSAYTDSITFFMKKESVEYKRSLDELLVEVNNPYHSDPNISLKKKDGTPLVDVNGVSLKTKARFTKADLLACLDELDSQDPLRKTLQEHADRVGEGVLLRDYHMTSDEIRYQKLSQLQIKYNDIDFQIAHPPADIPAYTPEQIQEFENQKIALKKAFTKEWNEFTLDGDAIFDISNVDELHAVHGLSPVEIETRRRIINELKMKSVDHPDGQEIWYKEGDVPEHHVAAWKVYDAIWYARNVAIGTGIAMEQGAKLGRSSVLDLKYKLGRNPEVKHFMNRGFAEPYQRVMNRSLFADDFNFGGAVGHAARDLYYQIVFKKLGYDFEKDASVSKEWKEKLKKATKSGTPKWITYADYAQEVLGISYSEIVRPELLATGLQTGSTKWRYDTILLTPLNEEALRLQEAGIISRTAEIDNEAIAHRFNAAKTDAEKERFLKKMLNREITVFTNMIGEDLQNLTKNDDIRGLHGVLQKAGVNPRSVEWQQFQRALSIAEKRLMKDDAYKWSAFNLGDRAQFDGLMPDALKAVGLAGTPGELDKMFKVITGVQDFMHAKGENGQSRIKNWVAHKPFANNIILSHGDFDWHKVDFNKLGAFSLERRINDFLGQAAAGTKFDELMTTSELLMPAPGKEVDTIMKIKELRNAIVSYSGMDDAEKMASAMMEVVIDMNKNRVIQGNPIFNVGWVPGAVSVMRRAVGIHESADQTINAVKNGAAWIIERFPGGKKVVHDHHLRPSHNHPHPKWPRSMAEAVSLAVGFQGFEGNAWDEYKIASFITGAETATLFADRPAYIEEMMSKYKASGFFRAFVGLPRKYWWVVFAATVAVATTSSVQEEAGSGGKSHH